MKFKKLKKIDVYQQNIIKQRTLGNSLEPFWVGGDDGIRTHVQKIFHIDFSECSLFYLFTKILK